MYIGMDGHGKQPTAYVSNGMGYVLASSLAGQYLNASWDAEA